MARTAGDNLSPHGRQVLSGFLPRTLQHPICQDMAGAERDFPLIGPNRHDGGATGIAVRHDGIPPNGPAGYRDLIEGALLCHAVLSIGCRPTDLSELFAALRQMHQSDQPVIMRRAIRRQPAREPVATDAAAQRSPPEAEGGWLKTSLQGSGRRIVPTQQAAVTDGADSNNHHPHTTD